MGCESATNWAKLTRPSQGGRSCGSEQTKIQTSAPLGRCVRIPQAQPASMLESSSSVD